MIKLKTIESFRRDKKKMKEKKRIENKFEKNKKKLDWIMKLKINKKFTKKSGIRITNKKNEKWHSNISI